jgi:hypothetical protein
MQKDVNRSGLGIRILTDRESVSFEGKGVEAWLHKLSSTRSTVRYLGTWFR